MKYYFGEQPYDTEFDMYLDLARTYLFRFAFQEPKEIFEEYNDQTMIKDFEGLFADGIKVSPDYDSGDMLAMLQAMREECS